MWKPFEDVRRACGDSTFQRIQTSWFQHVGKMFETRHLSELAAVDLEMFMVSLCVARAFNGEIIHL